MSVDINVINTWTVTPTALRRRHQALQLHLTVIPVDFSAWLPPRCARFSSRRRRQSKDSRQRHRNIRVTCLEDASRSTIIFDGSACASFPVINRELNGVRVPEVTNLNMEKKNMTEALKWPHLDCYYKQDQFKGPLRGSDVVFWQIQSQFHFPSNFWL